MFEQGKPNSIYHHTVAGLQALHFEMGDGSALPDSLTAEEVDHALAFGFFEINGFPAWFFPLAKKYPSEATKVLAEAIKHAGDGQVSAQHAERILTYFEKLPPEIRDGIESPVWDLLLGQPNISPTAIAETLKILSRSARAIDDQRLRHLLDHYFSRIADSDAQDAPTATPSDGVLSAWAAYWLSRDPSGFAAWITEKANGQPNQTKMFIYQLAVYLGDERRGDRESIVTRDAGLTVLKTLYLLVAKVVPHEKDTVQREMVVYATGGREYAERLREQLLHLCLTSTTLTLRRQLSWPV
jgi:hypothetical protein